MVLALSVYWEKVLPSDTDIERKSKLMIESLFDRRWKALRGLMDTVITNPDIYTRGGTDPEPFRRFMREQDHCLVTDQKVRSLCERIHKSKGACIYLGWAEFCLLIAGFLLKQTPGASSTVMLMAAVLLFFQFGALVRGRRERRILHHIEITPDFIGGGDQ